MILLRLFLAITIAIAVSSCGEQVTPQSTVFVTPTAKPAVKNLVPTFPIPKQPTDTAVPSLTPTRKPTSTSTPTPLPKPLPEPQVNCSQQSRGYYLCTDSVLQIEFEYPSSWGTIIPKLSRGETGQAYNYIFGITAGGLSRDFSMGRGSSRTDFYGFDTNRTFDNLCKNLNAAVCQPAKPDVFVVVLLPNAEGTCHREPGTIFEPEFIILIDLPQNEWINGFLFSSKFASDQLQQSLNEIIGLSEPDWSNCQSESARQQYDAAIKQVEEGLKTGSLDEGTMLILDALWRVAESIRIQ